MPRKNAPAKSPASPPSAAEPSPSTAPTHPLHPSFSLPHPHLDRVTATLLPTLARWSPLDFGRHSGHFLPFLGLETPHRLFSDLSALGVLIRPLLLSQMGGGVTPAFTPYAISALSTLLHSGASPYLPETLSILLCRYAVCSLLLPPLPSP